MIPDDIQEECSRLLSRPAYRAARPFEAMLLIFGMFGWLAYTDYGDVAVVAFAAIVLVGMWIEHRACLAMLRRIREVRPNVDSTRCNNYTL